MKIDSMKEVILSRAREIYLFDCRVAGLDSQTVTAYGAVLASFIRFTGDILVKELSPDHVRLYIANLSDGPSEGEEHLHAVFTSYAVIHDWLRWMYAQKFLTERTNDFAGPPRFLTGRSSFFETGGGNGEADDLDWRRRAPPRFSDMGPGFWRRAYCVS